MKRILSMLLVLTMLTGILLIGSTNITAEATDTVKENDLPFADVSEVKWFYNSVKAVFEAGIMEGKNSNTFAPNESMTRAQIVTIFYRLAQAYETGLGKNLKFTDTPKSAWYADYLGWAVRENLVSGYPEGDFRPNAAISRQELAKLIVVFLKYVIADTEGCEALVDSFADAGTFPSWSAGYIEALRETGLMAGDSSGNFNPKKTATRAEVATVLVRMLPIVKDALSPEPPPMGWNSYMTYHWTVTEEKLIAQMDAMVDKGLSNAGYKYVNIDDWWYTTRDEETGRVLVWEEHFPNGMKYIADQAHERGLKAGIYTDIGHNSCGSGESSLPIESGINIGLKGGNYVDDLWRYLGTGTYMDDYAKKTGGEPIECWGFDYIKADSNGTKEGVYAEEAFSQYAEAIDDIEHATGRYIHFNMCRWYYEAPYQMVYGDSWRCGGDSNASFSYVKSTVDKMKRVSSYTVPGHYADLDMFVLNGGMSLTEERTNFAMWCMFSSPLILSCDMTGLTDDQLEFLTNSELVAIDQDPLAYAAAYIKDLGDTTELWFKKTESYGNGAGAIAVYNPGDTAETVTVNLADICNSGKAQVRDVFAASDLGEKETVSVTVEPHEALIYTINTDEGYTSDEIGDYRVYGVVNTEYDEGFDEIMNADMLTMTLEVYEAWLKTPFRPTLVDVRSAEEFAKGHMKGAVNIPYTEVRDAITKLKLPLFTVSPGIGNSLVIYASDEETLTDAYREFSKYRYTVYSLGVITEFD